MTVQFVVFKLWFRLIINCWICCFYYYELPHNIGNGKSMFCYFYGEWVVELTIFLFVSIVLTNQNIGLFSPVWQYNQTGVSLEEKTTTILVWILLIQTKIVVYFVRCYSHLTCEPASTTRACRHSVVVEDLVYGRCVS